MNFRQRPRTGITQPEQGSMHGTTLKETARETARGRRPSTPFALVGGVALTVWLAAGVLSAIVVLVWLLV
jgi:hypothetical protein